MFLKSRKYFSVSFEAFAVSVLLQNLAYFKAYQRHCQSVALEFLCPPYENQDFL